MSDIGTNPTENVQSVIATLAGMSSVQAIDWLRLNANTLTALDPADVRQVEAFLDSKSKGDERWGQAREILTESAPQGTVAQQKAEQKKLEQGAAKQAQTTGHINEDQDGDGTVSASEKKAADKVKQDAATSGFSVSSSADPDWLVQANGGQPLSPNQKQRIVDEWNAFNPTAGVQSYADLAPRLRDAPDERTKMIASYAASGGDQPLAVSYQITLPGGRSVGVSGDQMAAVQDRYNLDGDDFAKVVKYADMFGVKTSTGNTAWQPLAALLKAAGYSGGVSKEADRETKLAAYKSKLDKLNAKPSLTMTEEYERRSLETTVQQLEVDAQTAFADAFNPFGLTQAINDLTGKFKSGLAKYGNDPELAYLHALDSDLASRMTTNPTGLTSTDLNKAGQLLLDGGFDTETMSKLGYATMNDVQSQQKNGYLSQLIAQAKAAAAGGAGRTRVAPDPEQVKQSVKDLWRAMFLTDPSDALVGQFQSELSSLIASTPMEQDIDVTARLRAFAESNPEYGKLYGNKPAGMAEGDYQRQFAAGVGDILGNQSDQDAVKLGMQSGDYNTSVGAAFNKGTNWSSSRLMQRLAQAAQTVNAST